MPAERACWASSVAYSPGTEISATLAPGSSRAAAGRERGAALSGAPPPSPPVSEDSARSASATASSARPSSASTAITMSPGPASALTPSASSASRFAGVPMATSQRLSRGNDRRPPAAVHEAHGRLHLRPHAAPRELAGLEQPKRIRHREPRHVALPAGAVVERDPRHAGEHDEQVGLDGARQRRRSAVFVDHPLNAGEHSIAPHHGDPAAARRDHQDPAAGGLGDALHVPALGWTRAGPHPPPS